MNVTVMSGRLTGEPHQIVTINGNRKVTFSIAVTKKFKKDGGPTADFFDCEAWDVDADNIFKYFHKGDTIFVEGRMENDSYTNREGVKVKTNILKVEEWDFGPKKLNRQKGE